MNRITYKKLLLSLFYIPLLVGFPLYYSYGTNISFSTINDLSFGALEVPAVSGNITINRDGSAPSGSYNLIHNTTIRGEYHLVNDTNVTDNSMSIDIQNVTTGSAALTLNNFKGIYGGLNIDSFPATNLTTPDTGGLTLYIGATLSYTNAVAEGNYNMTYNIVILYS